jgi:hypothetical protein
MGAPSTFSSVFLNLTKVVIRILENIAPARSEGEVDKDWPLPYEIGPTHFTKVIMSARLDLLPILDGFHPYLGVVPRIITLKTNNIYNIMVRLKGVNSGVTMDQGWPAFPIAHQIKIGYFLVFKILKGDIYTVTHLRLLHD